MSDHCQKCDGMGGWWDDGTPMSEFLECPTCEGSGFIPDEEPAPDPIGKWYRENYARDHSFDFGD